MKKGFTLIELIVVMAIIGILVAIVAVALNPAENLAKSRDVARISAMNQLIKALQAYSVDKDGFPQANSTWIGSLIDEGQLSGLPQDPGYQSGVISCTTNPQNGYCYYKDSLNPQNIVVYTKVESVIQRSKNPTCSSTDNVFFVWSTCASSTGINPGILCSDSQPSEFCDLPTY